METKHNTSHRFMTAAKLGLAAIVASVGLIAFAGSQPAKPADAAPTNVIGLNSALCTALGVAFGGLSQITADFGCNAFNVQTAFQEYTQCLAGFNNNAGCVNSSGPPVPGGIGAVYRPTAATFKALDLDDNQVHGGQTLKVIAFVDDDFPVRFSTDKGRFVNKDNLTIQGDGKTFECKTNTPDGSGDPDCDNDPSTVGDGVVVGSLFIDSTDEFGPGVIQVEQKNRIYPMSFSISGLPETITLTPLFGKDTISTGATPPTLPTANALETDCNFSATASGVLGAVNQAEKTVVVAKALDNEGTPVVGALLDWDHPIGSAPTDQGGVALPSTPTLDTGPLGVGFPQFICGLDTPGDFTSDVTFNLAIDPLASRTEHTKITIHVIKPAASIALSADPAVIDCNGTNTSKVTASVVNADGVPVANGLDVNFDVEALGTANPLKADSAAGVASTTISPLAGANGLGDGGPKGVTVNVSVRGQRSPANIVGNKTNDPFNRTPPVAGPTPRPAASIDFETIRSAILVQCSGALAAEVAPPPGPPEPGANAGGNAGAGGRPSGVITGPDTGTGSSGSANSNLWLELALAVAVTGSIATGVGVVTRRRRQ